MRLSNISTAWLEYCETFCFITRDNELQSDSIAKLSELNNLCLALKQCVSRGLAAELEMWILLKQGRLDDAWDKLIEAQMAVVELGESAWLFCSQHGEGVQS